MQAVQRNSLLRASQKVKVCRKYTLWFSFSSIQLEWQEILSLWLAVNIWTPSCISSPAAYLFPEWFPISLLKIKLTLLWAAEHRCLGLSFFARRSLSSQWWLMIAKWPTEDLSTTLMTGNACGQEVIVSKVGGFIHSSMQTLITTQLTLLWPQQIWPLLMWCPPPYYNWPVLASTLWAPLFLSTAEW